MNIHPKVYGAVSGSTLGGAFAELIVWILELHHVAMTPGAAAAVAVICSAAVAFIGGYLTPSPNTTTTTTTVSTIIPPLPPVAKEGTP